MIPRLLTIPLSHYAERARWALDRCEVDYLEEPHLQGFAGRVTRAHGARHTVPVLCLADRVLADSSEIVAWASDQQRGDPLFAAGPREQIEALSGEFAGLYGVETRRVAYEWFFRNLPDCLPYNQGAAPRFEALILRVARPLVVPYLERYLKMTPEKLERGRGRILATMDRVAARLADGRPYLMGDRFSEADLCFAAMTGISVLPPEYGAVLPPLESLDPVGAAWVKQMRAHPAGVFALRLYQGRPDPRGVLPRPAVVPRAKRGAEAELSVREARLA